LRASASSTSARAWDPKSKLYESQADHFWVWYLGRLEDYPAVDHPTLKARYDKALKAVPREVWDRELVELRFAAGPSLKGPDGNVRNPRLASFLDRYGRFYEKLGARPKRTVTLTFSDGGPGAEGSCRRTGPDAWDCPMGRDTAFSDRYFAWLERFVAHELQHDAAP
jgi:hypothetical protein